MLVHLHRADFVAADKCVRESYSIPGFSGSEDCVALEQLLQGYDQQDEEQVARVCNSPLFKYMDNDVGVTSALSENISSPLSNFAVYYSFEEFQ